MDLPEAYRLMELAVKSLVAMFSLPTLRFTCSLVKSIIFQLHLTAFIYGSPSFRQHIL